MAQRVGHSADGVFVMIVDEDKSHANFARGMLSSLNFHGKLVQFLYIIHVRETLQWRIYRPLGVVTKISNDFLCFRII